MFARAKKPTQLEEAIDKAMQSLDSHSASSEEYAQILDQVAKLHKIKLDEQPDRVSMDTLAVISANLLGIMLIIRHEHVNVITSRAMNLVIKPK
jgi:hypothetical protein